MKSPFYNFFIPKKNFKKNVFLSVIHLTLGKSHKFCTSYPQFSNDKFTMHFFVKNH